MGMIPKNPILSTLIQRTIGLKILISPFWTKRKLKRPKKAPKSLKNTLKNKRKNRSTPQVA